MKIEEMISANRGDCCGCEACANVCPKNVIEMRRDAEGFAYPTINRELCISCGRCDATCPALNFTKKNLVALPKVFAAINPDKKIRLHSSSGGAFSALSEIILSGGGVVFGAAFDENFHVFHTAARTSDELENLRGSKYTQSQIRDVYRQVKDALRSSEVLFSGTPCQCAGLKSFLGGEPENLLTVDIVCHGTPSPALWENYIAALGHAHEIKHVNFRSKRKGWSTSHVEINFADCGYYLRPLSRELYGKIFLRGLSERPSCYACKFKFPNGRSDLTLGDAWGVENFAPKVFDDRGTSLILVHTAKGEKFLSRAGLRGQRIKLIDAVKKNPRLIAPSIADARRENFFADFAASEDVLAVLEKYFYQDDAPLRQKVRVQNRRALSDSYNAIAAQVRKNFERNILVVCSPRDGRELKLLGEKFERRFPNDGVYLLQNRGDGQFACLEIFSSLVFNVKAESAALTNLAKKLNITEILVEKPIKISAPAVEWLKSAALPKKTFSLSQK